jgi:predicted amidophosphoribosyltransferase
MRTKSIPMRAKIIRLDSRTAVCACCNAELTKWAVETAVGVYGKDCWKTVKEHICQVNNCIQFSEVYRGNPEGSFDYVVTRQEVPRHIVAIMRLAFAE